MSVVNHIYTRFGMMRWGSVRVWQGRVWAAVEVTLYEYQYTSTVQYCEEDGVSSWRGWGTRGEGRVGGRGRWTTATALAGQTGAGGATTVFLLALGRRGGLPGHRGDTGIEREPDVEVCGMYAEDLARRSCSKRLGERAETDREGERGKLGAVAQRRVVEGRKR